MYNEMQCNTIIKRHSEDISFGLYINFKPVMENNINKIMIAASTVKLFILYYLLKNGYNKKIIKNSEIIKTPDSILNFLNSDINIEFLIVLMISESDNTSANFFIDLIGINNLNNFIKKEGFIDTIFERKFLDYNAIKLGYNNYTSVRDLKLLINKIFTSDLKYKFLSFFYMQKDRSKLSLYINDDVNIGGKSGELYNVYNDIIYYNINNQDIINIVLTNNLPFIISRELLPSIGYNFYKKLL